MVDCSSLKQIPCFQKSNFWQIAEVIPLWFSSIRQEMGMVDPLSRGWQLHKKNRWDLTGYFQEMESLKQEAGMPERLWRKLLLKWVNQGLFWQEAASIHRLPTVLFVMWQSYQSKVVLWTVNYLVRVVFDLCNTSCLYMILMKTICFALSVGAPTSASSPTSTITS